MIGQNQDDYDTPDPALTPIVFGEQLGEEDLEVGQHVCVLALKRAPNEIAPIMGQSLVVKAICLHYFVGQLLSDAAEPVLTLDCRYLSLMRVTKEFVDAQRAGAKAQQQQEQYNPMMTPQKKRRKEPEG